MADQDVDDALARSFLADLPSEVAGRLREEGERADYPAGGPASTGVRAVEPSGLFRISLRTPTAAARSDPQVGWAIAEELSRRLYDTLEQTAVTAQLGTLGYSPSDVGTAILSHLPQDHIGGLAELTSSDLLVSAWNGPNLPAARQLHPEA
jgi:glyoxylase-like metal-dependent hydrolase (beta-lactamase superfamily II)